MPYELVSLDKQNIRLSLAPGVSTTLGRQVDLGVTSRNVSREHCLIECQQGEGSESAIVTVKACKRCYIVGILRQQPCKLAPGQATQLSLDDVVYLSNEDSRLGNGFRLQVMPDPDLSQHSLPEGSGSLKRGRSPASPDLDLGEALVAGRRKRASLPSTASLAADEEPTGNRDPAGDPADQRPGVFAGLHFVFWVDRFSSKLRAGAQKAGATVEDKLSPAVTHVIAPRDTSARQAAKHFKAAGMETAMLEHDDSWVTDLPEGMHFVTPDWVSGCLAQGRLLLEHAYLISIARMVMLARLQAQASSSGQKAEASSGLEAEAAAVLTSGSPGVFRAGKGHAAGTVKLAKGHTTSGVCKCGHIHATSVSTFVNQVHKVLTAHGEGKYVMPPDMAAAWRKGTPLEHHPTRGLEAEWKLWQETGLGYPVSYQMRESSQGAAEERRALDLGPDIDLRPAGAERAEAPPARGGQGSAERLERSGRADSSERPDLEHPWDDPYDEAAAKETKRMLYDHYHKQDIGRTMGSPGKSPAKSPHGSTPAKYASVQADSSSDDEDGRSARARKNSECSHVACSTKRFCILRHMREIKENYIKDREKFNKLAMDVIMARVEALDAPLRTEADCDRVLGGGVGKDNVEKLKVVVRTGTFRRNETLAKDPHHQAIKLFLTVWGTGEKGAEAWWSQGCRTLDDLRARSDLSAQQAAGLKYYEDMQQRIPRKEVAAIEGMVKEAVLDVLSCRGAHDESALFCNAVGSYIRGKPDTGDVDMLILPPPSCIELDSNLTLHEVLQLLRKRGLLLDEMLLRKAPREKGPGSSATFLGLCRHATSPCVRRIDLKWYPRRYMPLAVTHFVGSGLFNRALRYWARTATQAAKAYNSNADGFQLSDLILTPIRKGKPEVKGDRQYKNTEERLGPAVECKVESDMFAALGLAYVPFRMRWWYNYE